jgi:hypothetical protein
MSEEIKVKINFNPKELPNLKAIVESWTQLDKVDETDSSITVEGPNHTVETMLGQIYHHAIRHGQKYTVHYLLR